MAEKIAFNKTNLDAIACLGGMSRRYVYDAKTPGLVFCITRKGSRSFYLYRRLSGRPTRMCLGSYPEMTPEMARTAAIDANGQAARGINPARVRKVARQELTVGTLFDDWLERHAKQHKKSWQRDEKNFELHLAEFKHRKISDVHRGDITSIHTKLGKDAGPYLANRMLALLSALFNWAATQHDFAKPNPCKGVKKFKEASRERFLQADELPAFRKAVGTLTPDMQDFFWMCIYTGARRANVQSMKWEQINTTRAEWCIPDTKGGMPVTIALPDPAVAIIKNRMGNGSAYVFASYGKSGHIAEPKKAWAALLTAAGLKDIRIHDLRRTLGSWMAAAGTSLPIIGKALGHKNQATTAVYARLNLDPVRESVAGATAAIVTASKKRVKKVQATVTDAPKALPASKKRGKPNESKESAATDVINAHEAASAS